MVHHASILCSMHAYMHEQENQPPQGVNSDATGAAEQRNKRKRLSYGGNHLHKAKGMVSVAN